MLRVFDITCMYRREGSGVLEGEKKEFGETYTQKTVFIV